jgi:pimeloyl-ACP methyl ester carboxylesterase
MLVHSVNAAASAAEVRPLYAHGMRNGRTVYALDLPGFGLSDRSDRAYTPRLMTDALHAMVAEIQRRHGPGGINAAAVSLGCEFLARAVTERPADYSRIALISPTGMNGSKPLRGPCGSTLARAWLRSLLQHRPWSRGAFRLLTRPGVVRFFLRRTWGSPEIDEALWAYCVQAARQPGAEHAPLEFLCGGLFSGDIHAIYEQLRLPVWMSHGTRGDFTDFRWRSLFEGRPNWSFSVFDTGAMPYFERPVQFFARADAHFGMPAGPSAPPRRVRAQTMPAGHLTSGST